MRLAPAPTAVLSAEGSGVDADSARKAMRLPFAQTGGSLMATRELPPMAPIDIPGPLTPQQVAVIQKASVDARLRGYEEGFRDGLAARSPGRRGVGFTPPP